MARPPWVAEFATVESDALRRVRKEPELTITQAAVLVAVASAPGRESATGIGEMVGLSKDEASRTLIHLEHDLGYVTSRQNPCNRRLKLYWLTPRGVEPTRLSITRLLKRDASGFEFETKDPPPP